MLSDGRLWFVMSVHLLFCVTARWRRIENFVIGSTYLSGLRPTDF
jgi:hypothetical protein